MATAKRIDAWDRAARLCWTIATAMGAENLDEEQFHPFAEDVEPHYMTDEEAEAEARAAGMCKD